MEYLKERLFEDALYYRKCATYALKGFGMWDSMYSFEKTRFDTIYSVILESGLEEEYLKWVQKKESEED